MEVQKYNEQNLVINGMKVMEKTGSEKMTENGIERCQSFAGNFSKENYGNNRQKAEKSDEHSRKIGKNREKSGEIGKNLHAINATIVHTCRFIEMGAAPLEGARTDGRSFSSPQTPSESSPGHSRSVD